jgi:hypothetical protein
MVDMVETANSLKDMESQEGFRYVDMDWVDYNESWKFAIEQRDIIVLDVKSGKMFNFPKYMLPEMVEACL